MLMLCGGQWKAAARVQRVVVRAQLASRRHSAVSSVASSLPSSRTRTDVARSAVRGSSSSNQAKSSISRSSTTAQPTTTTTPAVPQVCRRRWPIRRRSPSVPDCATPSWRREPTPARRSSVAAARPRASTSIRPSATSWRSAWSVARCWTGKRSSSFDIKVWPQPSCCAVFSCHPRSVDWLHRGPPFSTELCYPLTLWRPRLPYGYSYKASICARPG